MNSSFPAAELTFFLFYNICLSINQSVKHRPQSLSKEGEVRGQGLRVTGISFSLLQVFQDKLEMNLLVMSANNSKVKKKNYGIEETFQNYIWPVGNNFNTKFIFSIYFLYS